MPEDPFDRLAGDYAAEDAFERSPRGLEITPRELEDLAELQRVIIEDGEQPQEEPEES